MLNAINAGTRSLMREVTNILIQEEVVCRLQLAIFSVSDVRDPAYTGDRDGRRPQPLGHKGRKIWDIDIKYDGHEI